jgi:DNA-binding PadR family transcriptional regulator
VGFSPQTLAILSMLCADPTRWRHGYDLAQATGLKSGSLYPILIRLAERGLVEAKWEEEQPQGRPRRHLYRLTDDGLGRALAALDRPDGTAARPAPRARGRRGLTVEGAT